MLHIWQQRTQHSPPHASNQQKQPPGVSASRTGHCAISGIGGEIAVIRIGRAWYFERADVDRWIESRKERG